MIRQRLLHRVSEGPPSLGGLVGGHRGHVRGEVVAHVLEVGEQIRAMAEDRVVPDVRAVDLLEYARPRLDVEPLVVVDPVGLDADPLAVSPLRDDPAGRVAASASSRHTAPSGNRYAASDSGRISPL